MKDAKRKATLRVGRLAIAFMVSLFYVCPLATATDRIRVIQPPANNVNSAVATTSPVRSIPMQTATGGTQTGVNVLQYNPAQQPTSIQSVQPRGISPASPNPVAPNVNPTSPGPQLVKISASPQTDAHSANVPLRVLSNTAKPIQRIDAGNPLHRMPQGGRLIEPIADVPSVAALPTYSAVEAKPMPRSDSLPMSATATNKPAGSPSPPSSPAPEMTIKATRLPVLDVDVLQSSSSVVARQGQQMMRSSSSSTPLPQTASIAMNDGSQRQNASLSGTTDGNNRPSPQHSSSATPRVIPSDNAVAFQPDQRFMASKTPSILHFALAEKNPPPAERSTLYPRPPGHSPLVVAQNPSDSIPQDRTRVEISSPTSFAPDVAFANPNLTLTEFPMMSEPRFDEPLAPTQIASMTPDPVFPNANDRIANDKLARNAPIFNEVLLPKTPQATASLSELAGMDRQQHERPELPKARTIESQPARTPALAAAPSASLPHQRMPAGPVPTGPMPPVSPIESHIADNNHRQPPPRYDRPLPLPRPGNQQVPAGVGYPLDAPRMADARTSFGHAPNYPASSVNEVPRTLPPRNVPLREEPPGYASSRRHIAEQVIRSGPTGFARSRP